MKTVERIAEYDIQVRDLELLMLEGKLHDASRQLAQAFDRNDKLVDALDEARQRVARLKEEVDRLSAPPSTYGVYLSANDDGTINVLSQGRKARVNLHPSITSDDIKPGQELVLNESFFFKQKAAYEIQGEVVVLKERLDGARAIVTQR